ncbi:hypothetical protein H7H80_00830 [Mycobacterium interjectum]|nr:hypothetical protein [Mycobacterium interjectum]
MLQSQLKDLLTYGLPSPSNNWFGITPPLFNAARQTLQAYFGVGIGNFGWSMGQQLTFGPGGATAGAGGAWFPTPQFGGLHLGAIGASSVSGQGGGAVLASAGQAGKVGMLSVPANWANPTAEATLVSAVSDEAPANAGACQETPSCGGSR